MKPAQLVPGGPNSEQCISLGCYDDVLLVAYGSGKKVVLMQAHSFSLQQVLNDHPSEVSALSWSRTGGRLSSASKDCVIVHTPQSDFTWAPALSLKPSGVPSCLSWSHFGDVLLALTQKVSLWSFEVNVQGDLITSEKPLWNSRNTYLNSKISPDGRLVAATKEDKALYILFREGDLSENTSFPQLKSDSLKSLKLSHSAKVVHFDWKDISVFKMYLNYYNPNSILTICEDGWARVWSEYYSPTGIGFNIVFQLQTCNGMAAWLRDFYNLENHINLLARKQESLKQLHGEIYFNMNSKSCLLRQKKSEPEKHVYGAMLREKIPVEWFVVVQNQDVRFYMCEGLGSVPFTAINIKLHLHFEHFWSPEAFRWIPSRMPLFLVKEEEEVQFLSLDKTGDLVRWRKRFGTEEYGGYVSALTGVMGGHRAKIVQIECHRTLPLICTLDSLGVARVWNSAMTVKGDEKAVDALRHWGILEENNISCIRWTKSYAILLVATKDSQVHLYKWLSQTSNQLKLPTIHWTPQKTWKGVSPECIRLDSSNVDIPNYNYFCSDLLGVYRESGIQVWKLSFQDGVFETKTICFEEGDFLDARINSFLSFSEEESTYYNYLYSLEKDKITCKLIRDSYLECVWETNLGVAFHKIILSGILMLVGGRKEILCVSLQGNILGAVGGFKSNVKGRFLSKGQVTENLAVLEDQRIQVMAQKFLAGVGETNMPWKNILTAPLRQKPNSIGVSVFQQLLVTSERSLSVYLPDTPEFDLFGNLQNYQEPFPYYHPLMLAELIRINKTHLIKMILKVLESKIDEGTVCSTLKISLEEFLEAKEQEPPKATGDFDWFFNSVQPKQEETFSQQTAASLKQKIQNSELPGVSQNAHLLRELLAVIETFGQIEEQQRAIDEFSKVFYLNLKIFRFCSELKQPGVVRPSSLTTMDVAFALHSEHQDTLFQILFTEELNWASMRKYGMGIWIQSSAKIKSLVETIARNEFRANRDPKAVTLWYLALKKKNILQGLYKQDPNNSRVFQFLSNDFSLRENQVKALKNAFELRKQRKYEMSAGFFLLGDSLGDALEVLARDLGDPQLALVVARLYEGDSGEEFLKVVDKFLLNTGLEARDPWLISIAYTLLGNHLQSVSFLEHFPKQPLQTQSLTYWTEKTQPALQGFHPCLEHFVSLLQNTLKVKRQCQSPFNIQLTSRSAEAYLSAGLPVLALRVLKETDTSADTLLTEKILCTQLLLTVKDTLDKEWSQMCPSLIADIRYLGLSFNFPQGILVDFLTKYFYKRDLRHYQSALLVGLNMRQKGTEAVLHRAAVMHIILSRFSRDPFYKVKVATLAGISNELVTCLGILKQPETSVYDLAIRQRAHLFQISLCVFLSGFLVVYTRGNWSETIEILQKLEVFLNDQNSEIFQTLSLLEYEHSVQNDLVTTWLRYLIVNKLHKVFEQHDFSEIDDWFEKSLMQFNYMDTQTSGKDCLPKKALEARLGPGRGIKKRPIMPISRLQRRIHSWKRRLLLRAQKFMVNETMQSTQQYIELLTNPGPQLHTQLSPHFASSVLYSEFNEYFGGNTQVHLLLQHSEHNLSTFIYENPAKVEDLIEKDNFIYEENIKENANLFKNGLELFKSKDPVLGFAINPCDKNHMAVILQSKKDKVREVTLEHSIKCKQRNQELQLTQADPDSWENCLHQTTQEVPLLSPTLNSALTCLETHQKVFVESMKLPPETWHRSSLEELLGSLESHKSRSERFVNIAGHPLLPLYVTGSDSGVVTLWQYARPKSLGDFAGPSNSSSLTSIQFNSYGDKLGTCDAQGNFFLYKFDLQPTSFQPQLTMMSSVGSKASAFSFLNLGSVIATTGNKPRGFLSIYDTLLPPNKSLLHTDSVGGNIIHYVSRYQQVILGHKKGKLTRYDLRMMKVADTIDSRHENILDLVSDSTETTLVSAGSDGFVRIWDARNLTLREGIEVVPKKTRNRTVTKLEFLDNALFCSTSDGFVKLLRTTTN